MSHQTAYVHALCDNIKQVTVQARGWEEQWAAPACVFDAPQGFGEEVWSIPQEHTLLAWNMRGAKVVSEMLGFAGRSAEAGRGTINLQLRGSPGQYRAEGPLKFGHFYLTAGIVARVAEGVERSDVSLSSLRDDLIMVADRDLWLLLDQYVRCSSHLLHPPSRIELEARALLVVDHLITRHHTFQKAAKARGGLAPWQLERVCEAMISEMGGDPGLDELAAIVGCSPTHFSRAFKQSTGLAPFHWLQRQRIEKAKVLLEESRLSLAEIALEVGFSAQPQFTTAFGRVTGMTPGAWRRELLR